MPDAAPEYISSAAYAFFDACETGKGWDACKQFCNEAASFSCQSGALTEVTKLSDYCEWMKGMHGPMPDAGYEMTAFATDKARDTVIASAIFKGTHTGEGGPVPPTGKSAASDYAYVIQFEDDKISHMTKIWNDGYALGQLGWM